MVSLEKSLGKPIRVSPIEHLEELIVVSPIESVGVTPVEHLEEFLEVSLDE